MTKFKIVSIDMFRTLADLGNPEHSRWQKLLKDKYTVELAQECRTHLDNLWLRYFQQDKFLSVRSILVLCFTELLSSVNVEIDPAEATELWAQQHSVTKPFADSISFLNAVGKEYPICLASDTDDDMLGALKDIYAFNHIFTSEGLRAYKAKADGKFFSAIINHYGVRPEEIIHIGDDRFEIVGASKAGIVTCWLNRTAKKWSDDVKPDYEAKSLIEAAVILGIDVESVQKSRRE